MRETRACRVALMDDHVRDIFKRRRRAPSLTRAQPRREEKKKLKESSPKSASRGCNEEEREIRARPSRRRFRLVSIISFSFIYRQGHDTATVLSLFSIRLSSASFSHSLSRFMSARVFRQQNRASRDRHWRKSANLLYFENFSSVKNV